MAAVFTSYPLSISGFLTPFLLFLFSVSYRFPFPIRAKLAQRFRGKKTPDSGSATLLKEVLRNRICVFLGLLDLDPLVSGTSPAPDPSIIKQK